MNIVEYQRESVKLYLIDSEHALPLPADGGGSVGLLRVSHLHATWARRGRACQLEVNVAGRRIEAAGVLGAGVQLWCPTDELPAWAQGLVAQNTPSWWPR